MNEFSLPMCWDQARFTFLRSSTDWSSDSIDQSDGMRQVKKKASNSGYRLEGGTLRALVKQGVKTLVETWL